MSLSSSAVAQAAALPLAGLLPPPVVVHRSVVIVAAGGRDLSWPQERIASALLQRSGGRAVHLLLHGSARGADQAIGRAAHQLGWRIQSLLVEWGRYGRSAGPICNRRLLEQALAEAQAHTSPAFSASVLVIVFPGGPRARPRWSSVLPRRSPCCRSPRSAPLPGHKSVDRRQCAPAPERSRPAQRRWYRQAVWAGRTPFSLNRFSLSLLMAQGSDAHPAPHAHPHAFPVR